MASSNTAPAGSGASASGADKAPTGKNDAPASETAPKPAAETAEFVVAPRHTVTTNDGAFEPGQTVTLPIKDGMRLRDLGFLLDEDGNVIIKDEGPKTISGAEIPDPK